MLKPSVRNQAFGILISFFIGACNSFSDTNDNYPKDTTISKPNGKLKDSLTFYFPATIKIDTLVTEIKLDTLKQKAYSAYLYNANEPILFNYYLGHDIYRFVWSRAFNPPIIFTLNKDEDKVWLTTKTLDRHPIVMDIEWTDFVPPPTNPDGTPDTISEYIRPEPDSVTKADRFAKIVINETKNYSNTEWTKFEQLIKDANYWGMVPTYNTIGQDGSTWIIEAHTKNKYWFVDRWAPRDNDAFRKCGEYLIKLSTLNERIY